VLEALWGEYDDVTPSDRILFETAVIEIAGNIAQHAAAGVPLQFTLNLWQASEGFRGESSFRTWAYALARHAAGRIIRERGRQRRQIPLSQVPEIDALAARVRSETRDHLKSETRDQVRRLREELDPDDQALLILRIDRGFAWPDVARILGEDDVDLPRKIVSLRKRFERLKDRLRKATRG